MIDYKKKNEFLLFRYLLTVNNAKFHPELPEAGNGYKTIEELNKDKNLIFREILKRIHPIPVNPSLDEDEEGTKVHFFRSPLAHSSEQFILVAQAHRQKEVIQNYEHLTIIELIHKYKHMTIKHQPYAFIAVDTDPDVQIIAISMHKEMRNIQDILSSELQRLLSSYAIEIIIETIKEEQSFWRYVEQNIEEISKVSFKIYAPNMPSITKSVNSGIKNLINSTNSQHIVLDIQSRRDTQLILKKTDHNISSLAKCAEDGGGDFYFKKRGSQTIIRPQDIQRKTTAVISEESGGELPVDNTPRSSDSILTKIRKLFKKKVS